jgi:hypothetical protein
MSGARGGPVATSGGRHVACRDAGATARRAVAFLLAMTWVPAADAAAQTTRPPRTLEGVRLIVRPRVGDTLRLEVEQTVEMRGRRADAAVPRLGGTANGRTRTERAPDYGPRADRRALRTSYLTLFAHSVVEASDLRVTALRATTDSIAIWTAMGADERRARPAASAVSVAPVQVQVTTDGAMRVVDPPGGAADLSATLASVPGLLPAGPVTVGSVWTREMPLPSLPLGGFRADGVVQARLRLDSLTHGGRDAWISIDGVLRRDGAARDLPPGTRVITAGTLRGALLVDRTRAWIVDARTTMDVTSEVVAGPGGATPAMILDLRIEQRLRVR